MPATVTSRSSPWLSNGRASSGASKFLTSTAVVLLASIPPGHDAEVVGAEPCVTVDLGEDDADYAKRAERPGSPAVRPGAH